MDIPNRDYLSKHDVRGLSGLTNIGNTCYMNSILQCLNNLPLFSSCIRSYNFSRRLQKNNVKDPITLELQKLQNSMWDENNEIVPNTFNRVFFSKITERGLRNMGQNDSQEFLNFLLDIIHEETKIPVKIDFMNLTDDILQILNVRKQCIEYFQDETISDVDKENLKIKYKKYCQDNFETFTKLQSLNFIKNYVKDKHSIIIDLFTGTFLTTIQCHECKNISNVFEPFNMISLPILEKEKQTIYECLDNFIKEEVLDNDNKYHCDNCNKHVVATKKTFIWELPNILIVHFKRFRYGRMSEKLTNQIDFPLDDLTLSNYRSPIYIQSDKKYSLVAISEHSGSCNGGHYIAHCKSPMNGKWYRYNDNHVYYVPDKDIAREIVNENAYILFYARK